MMQKNKLKEALVSLRQRIGDIEGCTVVSRDGLIIASELLSDVGTKSFAALSADVTKSGEILSAELKIGNLSQIIISSTKGNIVTTPIGKKAVLVCLIQKKANLGLVMLHMERTAKRLSNFIN